MSVPQGVKAGLRRPRHASSAACCCRARVPATPPPPLLPRFRGDGRTQSRPYRQRRGAWGTGPRRGHVTPAAQPALHCARANPLLLPPLRPAVVTQHPVAQVSEKPSSWGGRTTLACQVHDFCPKDMAAVWLKNGEVQPQETSYAGVLPSRGETYQTWATIEIAPSSNHNYACSVRHESLGAALRVAWDKGRTGNAILELLKEKVNKQAWSVHTFSYLQGRGKGPNLGWNSAASGSNGGDTFLQCEA
ncbi:H-2 class I histocompatibility antigen, D-P alpha chain-like isoform X2 [Alligator mississippiensis]|uniref:H-2 class I histocompatibility antigen, D-P alpha chain-like isoform X2 n=1 Tax=Alligator mississippiensis TaxID=8496 RepID=UPI0028774AB8|nr:H-2 class I histocompatibility antigen, D-P alpha chain-like isoform X2 [Alligator mississippiensis]